MMMIDSIYVSLRPGIMHMSLELSLDHNLSLLNDIQKLSCRNLIVMFSLSTRFSQLINDDDDKFNLCFTLTRYNA